MPAPLLRLRGDKDASHTFIPHRAMALRFLLPAGPSVIIVLSPLGRKSFGVQELRAL